MTINISKSSITGVANLGLKQETQKISIEISQIMSGLATQASHFLQAVKEQYALQTPQNSLNL